jgi:hypothetical protein
LQSGGGVRAEGASCGGDDHGKTRPHRPVPACPPCPVSSPPPAPPCPWLPPERRAARRQCAGGSAQGGGGAGQAGCVRTVSHGRVHTRG